MIVVPVLMTSCQVSLKPKIGPVIAHRTTMAAARANVDRRPESCAVFFANRVNQDVLRMENLREPRCVHSSPASGPVRRSPRS